MALLLNARLGQRHCNNTNGLMKMCDTFGIDPKLF